MGIWQRQGVTCSRRYLNPGIFASGKPRAIEEKNDIWLARHFAASQSELLSEKALIGVDLQDECDSMDSKDFRPGRARSHQGKVGKSEDPSCTLDHKSTGLVVLIGLRVLSAHESTGDQQPGQEASSGADARRKTGVKAIVERQTMA